MKSFVILPVLLSLAAAVQERNLDQLPPFLAQRSSRIIDGYKVEDRKYAPFMCSITDLYYGPGHLCGCSIVDKRHIVTAGHCVYPGAESDYIIYCGFAHYNTSDQYVQKRLVSNICRHPNYDPNTMKNDLAIMTLTEDLEYNELVQPIPLHDQDVEPVGYGDEVTVVGWGVTEQGAQTASEDLMAVDITYTKDADCVQNYSSIYPVDTCGMCCAYDPGQDSCQGDSGGPLVYSFHDNTKRCQVGIVSWGYGCAQPGYPGVYTKVDKYHGWIKENLISTECVSPKEEYTC